MKRNIFAVCDPEAEYAENFADYINKKNRIPFEVHAFTSAQSLLDYAGDHEIELLLVNAKALTREVRLLDVGKLVVLSEGEELSSACDSVYKYQAISKILQETMAVYGEPGSAHAALPVLRKTVSVYGIYSPIGRSGKTTFALALGQELARTSPTLYLNLEGFSGFGSLMQKEFRRGLGDLLYYARLKEEGLIHRINSMVQTVEHLDFIPPVVMKDDIQQAEWGDIEAILNELLSYSNYENLVIDIGNDFADPWRVMQWCKTVFVPVLEDTMSVCKMEQFEACIQDPAYCGIRERLKKVRVPLPSAYLPAGNYAEQLLWSEAGDYVRQVLSEGKL